MQIQAYVYYNKVERYSSMLMKKGKITIAREDDQQEEQPIEKSKKIFKPEKKHKKREEDRNEAEVIKSQVQEEPSNRRMLLDVREQPQGKIAHLAICFPDSILQVPQTSALRAYFISQIARITSIFKVDEIVVLKDQGYTQKSENFTPCDYIARNLQYLQTPQYLRKSLFKKHPDLNNVGLMNPIEARHHLRADQKSQFREGVALERPTKAGAGSWVDIGLRQQARMDVLVLPLTRVTLRIKNYEEEEASIYHAQAISKSTPRQEKGIYWGYDVRIAHNLKEVVKGYDAVMLCNHTDESHGLPEVTNVETLDLGQQRVMLYFSGTDNLDEMIKRDPKPKWTLEETLAKINYSLRLAPTGVKQLRLQERMILTLSKFASMTL